MAASGSSREAASSGLDEVARAWSTLAKTSDPRPSDGAMRGHRTRARHPLRRSPRARTRRPLHEHANALLRRFPPKRRDPSISSRADLDAIARRSNHMPRHFLDWVHAHRQDDDALVAMTGWTGRPCTVRVRTGDGVPRCRCSAAQTSLARRGRGAPSAGGRNRLGSGPPGVVRHVGRPAARSRAAPTPARRGG